MDALESSSSKRWSAVIAGIVGSIAGCACTAIAGLTFFTSSSTVDPSLIAALVPLVLVYLLIVGVVIALANGALWFVLARKKAWKAVPWMILSLVGALGAPYIILLGIVLISSLPSMEPPSKENLFWCCGIPGTIVGLLALVYWLSRPKSSAGDSERAPESLQGQTGSRAFGLGVIVSILTATVFTCLFGIVVHYLLQADIDAPPTTGWLGGGGVRLDTALYLWASIIVASIATAIFSFGLALILVVPRVPTKAGKVVNPVLLTLLSVILHLLLDAMTFIILYVRFYPPK